nr:hypothetical protein [Azospirillum brasilense]
MNGMNVPASVQCPRHRRHAVGTAVDQEDLDVSRRPGFQDLPVIERRIDERNLKP